MTHQLTEFHWPLAEWKDLSLQFFSLCCWSIELFSVRTPELTQQKLKKKQETRWLIDQNSFSAFFLFRLGLFWRFLSPLSSPRLSLSVVFLSFFFFFAFFSACLCGFFRQQLFFFSSPLAITFRQLQRPDRLPRQGSRQSDCDGSLLAGDVMLNSSQAALTRSSQERKSPVTHTSTANSNTDDLTSIAVNHPGPTLHSQHRTNNHPNNPEETSSRQTLVHSRSGETKQVERSSRKECYRLGRRKLLFEKRRKASDYALFFAMIGLLLMVLEQELTMAKIYDKVRITPNVHLKDIERIKKRERKRPQAHSVEWRDAKSGSLVHRFDWSA